MWSNFRFQITSGTYLALRFKVAILSTEVELVHEQSTPFGTKEFGTRLDCTIGKQRGDPQDHPADLISSITERVDIWTRKPI